MKAFYFNEPRKSRSTILESLAHATDAALHLVDDGECVAAFDATDVLDAFARKQASINVEKIEKYCSEKEYAVVVKWLATGSEGLREAVRDIAAAAQKEAQKAMSAADDKARAALRAGERVQSRASYTETEECISAFLVARAVILSTTVLATEAAMEAVYASTEAAAAQVAAKEKANEMLTSMVKEATGWEI